MRALCVVFVTLAGGCFSGYTPRIYDDQTETGSAQLASASCAEQCDADCASVTSSKARANCITGCLTSCEDDKTSCPRPDTETCTACTPAKAKLCEPCKKNDDCSGTGSLCLSIDANGSGHCGQACVVDCDCPATYECRGVTDPKTGKYDTTLGRQCVPESKQCPQCYADKDCESGSICEAGACVAACADDAACTNGERCFEDGRCDVACCEDKDCQDGQHCAEGRCAL